MPELGPYGSVRGARGNSRPYRESHRGPAKPTRMTLRRHPSARPPWSALRPGWSESEQTAFQFFLTATYNLGWSISSSALVLTGEAVCWGACILSMTMRPSGQRWNVV